MWPKNEDSDCRRLSDDEAAKTDDWSRRLDSWMTEVLLRCANDIGGIEKEPPQKVAASKWISGLGLLVAVVVLSLFVMATAHIIARFPWLAVLIALPWTLYVKYKKE
ncbi:hypothetical protein SAMN05192549_103388 [Duganella sacchari]|uniref:Uncharacterized protein n=2 Tax=Duganella sacchari TaxID=551987 RepID=A0A1M7MYL8_9BURK|nr:hypothetical protein SAMN05192549_103388 [Duganella sacchari]